MDDGIPQPPTQRSLASGLGGAARGAVDAARGWWAARPSVEAGKRDWWVAGALAALIAAGPVLTIAVGSLMASSVRGEVRKLEAQAAPRAAAAKSAAEDRATLVALMRRTGFGATAEALARALPVDAVLIRAERGRDGLLEVDISAPDPDRLRSAIRAEPTLSRLRDAGQQRGDLMMTVSFKEISE